MIRATTGGVLRSYRANLMKSFISQNNAMNTIISQRTFNSYAEDPASAAKAFRLRKSRMTVHSQSNICNDTLKKYETGFSSLQSIDDVLSTKDGVPGEYMKTLKGTTLSMLNDPEGDAREQLAKVLDQMSEMLVQNMNQKYGDNFIFAGADGHNVPFEVKSMEDGTKKLFYRGVPVDATMPELFDAGGAHVKLNAAGEVDNAGDRFVLAGAKIISKADYKEAEDAHKNDPTAPAAPDVLCDPAVAPATEGTPHLFKDKDGNEYYILADAKTMTQDEIDKAALNTQKLDYLADEKLFVDIGLGFQENEDGKLIESSAFNAALNGIKFLGYGLDADGDPKNLYSLVQKMKEVSESVPEAGKWDTATWDEFDRLVGKFETACSSFTTEFVNMAASTTKLETNSQLLEDNFYNLQEQYAELEDIEPVEAINNFLWAQYAYNAALKVGNSVLSQSLMDYLN